MSRREEDGVPFVDLMIRIGRRDEEAFAELHRTTVKVIGPYIRKVLKDSTRTEEVMQEVFLAIWQNAVDYREERGCPLAWMHMLARSRAIDRWRRDRKERFTSPLDERVISFPARTITPRSDEAWRGELLRKGIRELPAEHERLIQMAYFQGLTQTEIARSIGVPLGTVKSRIRGAIRNLRKSFSRAPERPGRSGYRISVAYEH